MYFNIFQLFQYFSWYAGDEELKKKIHPGFEIQGRHHQKSKTGVSVAPHKGLVFYIFFQKILKQNILQPLDLCYLIYECVDNKKYPIPILKNYILNVVYGLHIHHNRCRLDNIASFLHYDVLEWHGSLNRSRSTFWIHLTRHEHCLPECKVN